MMTLEVQPAYCWDCIRCGRECFTRFPHRLFRWDSPEDMATLAKRYTQDDIAKLKAAYPNEYRVTLLPMILECRCGFTKRLYGQDDSPLEVIEDAALEPAEEPAPFEIKIEPREARP